MKNQMHKQRASCGAGKRRKITEAIDCVFVKHQSKVQSVFLIKRGVEISHGFNRFARRCCENVSDLVKPVNYTH